MYTIFNNAIVGYRRLVCEMKHRSCIEPFFAAITDLVTTDRCYITSITCIYTSITFSIICSITWGFLKSAYFSMRSTNISLLVLSLVQFNKFSTRFSWSSKILSGKTKCNQYEVYVCYSKINEENIFGHFVHLQLQSTFISPWKHILMYKVIVN